MIDILKNLYSNNVFEDWKLIRSASRMKYRLIFDILIENQTTNISFISNDEKKEIITKKKVYRLVKGILVRFKKWWIKIENSC